MTIDGAGASRVKKIIAELRQCVADGPDSVSPPLLLDAANALEAALLAPMPQPEQCICAAIQLPNGEVWRGHRHDDAIRTAGLANCSRSDITAAVQGFITSHNRFVGREEGARLHGLRDGLLLFSEDLYLCDWRSAEGAPSTEEPSVLGAGPGISSAITLECGKCKQRTTFTGPYISIEGWCFNTDDGWFHAECLGSPASIQQTNADDARP